MVKENLSKPLIWNTVNDNFRNIAENNILQQQIQNNQEKNVFYVV